MKEYLINPDIHGRTFWKDRLNEKYDFVIFLGDYLDPYRDEHISKEEALLNFEEIIEYKKTHDNVILLLGNHDLHYMDNIMYGGRRDEFNRSKIKSLFLDNYKLFQVGYYTENISFTHAAIMKEWANRIKQYINITGTDPIECIDKLNSLWYESVEEDNPQLYGVLSYCSFYRGGIDSCSSPVWADVREAYSNELLGNQFQIFGHTQLLEPLITSKFACIDTHKSFLLSEIR